MLQAQRHAKEVHDRLHNPSNAVRDDGIDLKRKKKPKARVIPIDQTLNVPVTVPFSILEAGDIANIVESDVPFIGITEVQRVVCRHFGVSRIDLLSQRRPVRICWPRQVAMYLAKTITLKSLPHIGRRFGDKDHTTVLHAVRKVENKMVLDAALKAEVESLKKKILGEDDGLDG